MFRLLFSLFALAALGAHARGSEVVVRSIEATEAELRFEIESTEDWSADGFALEVLPLLPGSSPHANESTVVCPQLADDGAWVLARCLEGRDLVYSRFRPHASGHPAAEGHGNCVTHFESLPDRQFSFPRPASIKGLQVQMVDDAIKLGIKHAGLNVSLPQLLHATEDSPLAIQADGERIPLNAAYVASLDRRVKPLTDAGVNVLAIFLNTKYGLRADSPLKHPATRLDEAPTFSIAFNLTTPEAVRRFRAALTFLAERYSRPEAPHGWISGYIIGNEVQSHWMWSNRGSVDDEVVIDEYATALRLADLAVRSQHTELRVYASLDHFWEAKIELPAGRSMPGRKLLDRLNAISKLEGDFPWGVAMHPYPENLFNPKFWEDTTAPLRIDAPRITLHNIEVLTRYLRRPEMLCGGEPRRVTLSEQGFHTVDHPNTADEGEQLQAAAFARAYHKLRHLEGIDSFLLHRHVDHADEGGLKLGLWTRRTDVGGSTPERPKKIYEVFRVADTDQWEQAFEFAKPYLGIVDWSEALPQAVP